MKSLKIKTTNIGLQKKLHCVLFSLFIFLCFNSFQSIASEAHQDNSDKKPVNAGEIIVEHIKDAHEWHILSIGSTHISLPLPVILYSDKQFHLFLSSKFHHGHSSYQGFKLETEGVNKGKVVKVKADGITTDDTASLPLDFSITKNVLSIFIAMFVLCIIFISIARAYKKRGLASPKGMQSFLEPIILFVRDDVIKPSIGEKKYERYLPFLMTLFFFIFFCNLMGLIPIIPGGANVTGNISVTLVLALFTFIVTSVSGNKSYWMHIINAPGVPWWLKFPLPLMPIVELLGVITKPFVLMVRLFANIMAGHIIVLGFISIIFIFGAMSAGLGFGVSPVSVLFAVFMGLLELLVAFIQAYVFTLLSSLYIGMAIEEHHEHQAEQHH